MAAQNRRGPPGGRGRPSGEFASAAGIGTPRITHPAFQSQASLRRRDFARAAVFEEFRHKNAVALDYGDFVDRKPNQASRSWGVAP